MRSAVLNNSVLIGGCARSGTTILGKLIGSLDNVEYFFEPSFLHKFIYAHRDMSLQLWGEILSWYLYDDLLLNSLAGRNLNWNKNEDSCVLNFKSEEIRNRLCTNHRKNDIEARVDKFKLAIKIPDLIFNVPLFKAIYPDIKAIAMIRKPEDVIFSVLVKNWFTDEALTDSSITPQIPYVVVNKFRYPLWVPSHDYNEWRIISPADRAVYYYLSINKFLWEKRSMFFVLSYEHLLAETEVCANRISHYLGSKFSEKTMEVIKSISPRSSKKLNLDTFISSKYREELNDFIPVYEKITALSYDKS